MNSSGATRPFAGRRWPLILPLLLAGCATAADGTRTNLFDDMAFLVRGCDDLTGSDRNLCEAAKQHASTRLTGAASGGALGCVVGLGAGALATRDTGATVATTAAGCAVGAFLGYAAGAYVDRVNTEAASAQTDLRARVAAAEEDTARYRQAADDADASVRALRADIARLNRELAAGSITADDYADRIARASRSADSMRSLIVESQGTVGYVERDIAQLREAGKDTSELDARLVRLKQENERLMADYRELVAAIDEVPPGVDRPDVA